MNQLPTFFTIYCTGSIIYITIIYFLYCKKRISEHLFDIMLISSYIYPIAILSIFVASIINLIYILIDKFKNERKRNN